MIRSAGDIQAEVPLKSNSVLQELVHGYKG